MDTVEPAEVRVARGVAWLDANGPEEWWNKVSLPQLEISSMCSCVLGQVFSTPYNNGWTVATDPGSAHRHGVVLMTQPIRYGFDALDRSNGHSEEEIVEDYDALQQCWEEVIAKRKAESGTLHE